MKKEYVLYKLTDAAKESAKIDRELFKKYGVKRGLRNEDGTGVLVGLTNIGNVVGYDRKDDGTLVPIPGQLYYRGYELRQLVAPLAREGRFGFEEVAFLLLSGALPDHEELETFRLLLNESMPLDHRNIVHIVDLEGSNIMNILARSVLEMYTFDANPDDLSRENLIRQAIELIARFPTIIAYAWNIYRHTLHGRSLHIRHPKENLSMAENFLYMVKREYTPLEARMLDLLLIVQAEHGGGNNSTFTVRVTSSTRTDTYSSIAAGIGSLKGPLHGGANIRVIDMFHHLKENIRDWTDTDEIDRYLERMLRGEAYDGSGLIYGIGHAVYTLSDPRAELLKETARELAREKRRMDEYEFLLRLEEEAKKCVAQNRNRNGKPVCSNVDFFSGFIYELIDLPVEIYTPIFAMARIVGWMAHRIEELTFEGRRIIRPAYKNVADINDYTDLARR